jgi:hypothetical protein
MRDLQTVSRQPPRRTQPDTSTGRAHVEVRGAEEAALRSSALCSASLRGSLAATPRPERMVHSIARPPPVRANDRADELAGSEGQQSGSSERGKVMGDVAGLKSAPAASLEVA